MGQCTGRFAFAAAVLAAGLSLSACSGTDVELKGGVFDLMGVSGPAAKRSDPKLADRPGIVVPPSTASLPPPIDSSAPVIAANGEAFPVNPEEAKRSQVADIVAQHKAFCERARQRHDAGLTTELESSPHGACHQSVLRNFTGSDLSGTKRVGAE